MRTKLLVMFAGLVVATSAWAGPQIQSWQAPSGARVLFVENHDLPMLDVAVSFAAGSAYDTAEKSGLAALTHGLLDHGSVDLSEDEVAKQLADVGAQLGGGFDPDRAAITLRTLSHARERGLALSILAQVVQQPVFPQAVIEREQARIVAGLKEAETHPEHLADKAFRAAVFGTHPYALSGSGEVATVGKLSRAEIEAFYSAHYLASGAVVALMGDVTRAEAEAIAQQLTERLPRSGANFSLPRVPALAAASERRIPHPAKQSHVLIGAPGMSRSDPDYFALYVGNYVLGGGGFVSRLMEEVREKRGLAYDVHSYFMPMQQAGAFQIGLQTKGEQAEQALQLVRKVLADFIAQGPTERELLAAKQNIVGGFPLRVDSNRKILDYLSVIGFYHLPLDYLDAFPSKVERVTTAQVRAAFARHLDPARMATVLVGGGAGEPK
ncbi:pitrilysin family protein [Ferriphaselus sp. R-1]|uniref:M16 family metallopeptidase n=1 Tax=Ferriphaselus sp. R-1 TaxID=1485544 RepID=UPI000553E680|nr:pitrilysin family protein [Ferriphaselus sp. R-1]